LIATAIRHLADRKGKVERSMVRRLITFTFLCASLRAQVTGQPTGPAAESANQVVQWNRNLLAIVRTPGAQPGTIHSTRSFALMHAAIYDAVNSIDGTHHAYLVQVQGISPDASQEAAAASAAHEVLASLYPKFQATFDTELEKSLAAIPDSRAKDQGIGIGQIVADQILVICI
jgi:hypothetical protein